MPLLRGRRISRNLKGRVMRPAWPNAGIAELYSNRICALVDKMHARVAKLLLAAYRRDTPVLAQDQEEGREYAIALSAAATERLRRLAEGEDPSLPGEQAPVYELERAGLIERAPQYQWAGAQEIWRLTAAGEELAIQFITPAARLGAAVRGMASRWQRQFDEAAPKLAEYFSKAVAQRSVGNLKSILKAGGFTVQMQMTPALRDVARASVEENVALIRSIPSQYFTEIEGLVMRSVQRGRDLKQLSDDLEERYDITRRRAKWIAIDQNNKASSAITHAREAEIGIRQAVWMHSHAGKVKRPTHVKMDGKVYDVTKGMWDPHEKKWIFPGELPRCRCTQRPILPGLTT